MLRDVALYVCLAYFASDLHLLSESCGALTNTHTYTHTHTYIHTEYLSITTCTLINILRGGADKSLARSTSRCRRTESIVSLERGVCSCAELQFFLVTEAERKDIRRRARFQQYGDASCHQVCFSYKARRRRKFTPF